MNWIADQLVGGESAGETSVVFMHGYPDDLQRQRQGRSRRAARKLKGSRGSCHRDGWPWLTWAIPITTNSPMTGRRSSRRPVPPGKSTRGLSATASPRIDNGVVSWRFRPLDDPFPFVMITSPADHRLLRGETQRAGGDSEVRARIFGSEPIARVEYQADEGPWTPMSRIGEGPDWRALLQAGDGRLIDLMVRAFTQRRSPRRPRHPRRRPAGYRFLVAREAKGSDVHAVGAWPENGVLGTQLGPNRNGRKW